MSIASYRENVRKRVAGPNLPVCHPASLEQISPKHKYRPRVYLEHMDFLDWHYSIPRVKRDDYLDDQAEALEALYNPLGLGLEDIVFKRVFTPLGFIRTARALLREDYRLIADVTYGRPARSGTHAIGLIPTGEENHFFTVSNHVQKALEGIVTLQQVADHIAIQTIEDEPHFPDYPFSGANITALPPLN